MRDLTNSDNQEISPCDQNVEFVPVPQCSPMANYSEGFEEHGQNDESDQAAVGQNDDEHPCEVGVQDIRARVHRKEVNQDRAAHQSENGNELTLRKGK